jgi:hypothetical protein
MKKTLLISLSTLAALPLFSLPALAVAPLSSAELASHCIHYRKSPAGKDGIFCVRYIQGFIDGAVATDERVAINVAAEYENIETFAERATRTRLGNMLDRYGASVYAEYCLGDPIPLATVVDSVVAKFERVDFNPAQSNARDLVYQVLRDNYPCAVG